MLRVINSVKETPVINNEGSKSSLVTSFRGNDYERTPDEDTVEISTKNNSNKNLLIGLGAAAVLATVGIIGHKQGWFKKAAEEAKPEEKAKEEIKNTVKELVISKDSKAEKTLEEKINALNKYLDETEKLSPNASESKIKSAFRKAAKKANAQNDEKTLAEINSVYQDIQKGIKKRPPKQIAQESEAAFQNEIEKQGKLNYELKIDGNTIVVENGKIKKAINSNNQEWMITDKTDKGFVEKINDEISRKNREIIAKEKFVKLANKDYLNSVDVYAKQMNLNGEILVDDVKIIFEDGTPKKILSAQGKELSFNELGLNKSTALDFLKKIHEQVAQRYEKEVVVPQARAEIEQLTAIYDEYMPKVKNVYNELHSKNFENLKWKSVTVEGEKSPIQQAIVHKDGIEYRIRSKNDFEFAIKKGDDTITLIPDDEIMFVGNRESKFENRFKEGVGNITKLNYIGNTSKDFKQGEISHISRFTGQEGADCWEVYYNMQAPRTCCELTSFKTDLGDLHYKS